MAGVRCCLGFEGLQEACRWLPRPCCVTLWNCRSRRNIITTCSRLALLLALLLILAWQQLRQPAALLCLGCTSLADVIPHGLVVEVGLADPLVPASVPSREPTILAPQQLLRLLHCLTSRRPMLAAPPLLLLLRPVRQPMLSRPAILPLVSQPLRHMQVLRCFFPFLMRLLLLLLWLL